MTRSVLFLLPAVLLAGCLSVIGQVQGGVETIVGEVLTVSPVSVTVDGATGITAVSFNGAVRLLRVNGDKQIISSAIVNGPQRIEAGDRLFLKGRLDEATRVMMPTTAYYI